MAEIIVNPAETTTPIDVVCGNANAEIIRFVFDRSSDGVDLADCAWAVVVRNSAGFSDTYMEGRGIGNIVITEETVSVEWSVFGIAVGTTGRTIYQLVGVQGKAIVKQFPYHTLNVLSYLQTVLSSEASEDMTAMWETIDYVSNQLEGIIAAESERASAEAERQRAENARNAAFENIDLRVTKQGTITTITVTNPDGVTTSESIRDGADGDGSGDMVKEIYDPDNDGIVEYSQHTKDLPIPSTDHVGKQLVVNESGAYELRITDVATETDPGAGADSEYPDGTEINVYE